MSECNAAHEDFTRPDDTSMGSERAFGFVMAGFCVAVGVYLLWHGRPAAWAWIVAGGVFAAFAALFPDALRPLNRIWYRFGLLLHRIVSPVILALMYFAVFTPLGLLMRIVKKRPLQLDVERSAGSYWIERKPAGPDRDSFRNQF